MSAKRAQNRAPALAFGAAALCSVLLLSGCTPVVRSALRFNGDGTVDFVSCAPVAQVVAIDASTFELGSDGRIDEGTEVGLATTASVKALEAGQIVTFEGLPTEWHSLSIFVEGESGYVSAGVDGGPTAEMGDWEWNDGGLFGWAISYSPSERCDIQE